MSFRAAFMAVVVFCAVSPARADEVLYRYEGDVLPYDPSAGWLIFDPCEDRCTESVDTENGYFVLEWPEWGGGVNYHYWIAVPPDDPPPTLWVEWRFRSDDPLPPFTFGCDGRFAINYRGLHEVVYMHGDAAVSFSGDDYVTGLDIDEFHTYRFESLDGINYRISVDGRVFIVDAEDNPIGSHYLQFSGRGGCDLALFPNTNEWDFVRFGTISFGEQIIASDPPAGVINAFEYPDLGRFTVTFDTPNYVYIDDITVDVTGGATPVVVQTRRREGEDTDTVEIVLDRPMTIGETTTFTFDDAAAVNVIEYTPLYFDTDGDGLDDNVDNCPYAPNVDQSDIDDDGLGDVCDNCPYHANPDQLDCDNDGQGDVCTIEECTGDPACGDCNVNAMPDGCEYDSDGDGLIDDCDGCPNDPDKTSPGVCGCGVSDVDSDGDTVPDCVDQCPGEDDLADRNHNGTPDCLEEGPVPTLSAWGLVAMGLLLLIVAKVRSRVRPSSAA